jgi:hypothetical protein
MFGDITIRWLGAEEADDRSVFADIRPSLDVYEG